MPSENRTTTEEFEDSPPVDADHSPEASAGDGNSSPMRLAVVTGDAHPSLTRDDRRVLPELEARGFDPEPVVWHADVDWDAFDAALVRSCFDYHERPQSFLSWLDRVAAADVTIVNPPAVLRWNVHKSYLVDLADAGVPVLETMWLAADADAPPDLETVLDARGWSEAVVKPAIGTSSARTWRVAHEAAAEEQPRFASLLDDRDVLVQRFAPEIRDGERSLVFFGGEYSHATVNVPAPVDFRSHPTYGGTTKSIAPAPSVLADAETVLRRASDVLGVEPAELPYARVDGIVRDGQLRLMELELVEPYLSLGTEPAAPGRFADAIAAALARDRTPVRRA